MPKQALSISDHKYGTLMDIILYLRSLAGTGEHVGPSNSAGARWATSIMNLCKKHVDVTELSEGDFLQLIFEFETTAKQRNELYVIRYSFLKLFLEGRSVIEFNTAKELCDLTRDWGESRMLIIDHIDWNNADAEHIIMFGKKFDTEAVWKWIVEKNNTVPKIANKTMLRIAKRVHNFPKEVLIEWAEATV